MKIKRHNKIIELVKTRDIETQEELINLLKDSGFNVTQATVSRDIRDLKLTKINTSGKQKYAFIQHDFEVNEKYVRVLREGFVSMTPSGNLIVVKTVTGMAMAVATAIDALELKEIIGCIAGDDTIFVAVLGSPLGVMNEFKRLINQ